MLRYLFPEYLPGAVPFAFNGGGIFYAFDVRHAPEDGEFPIIAVASGVLDFEYSPTVASTFVDLCRGPHIPATGAIKATKLTNIAGAYWKGNENNKQSRINQ